MLSVSLKPVAGFCIKTSTVQPSSFTPLSLKQSPSAQDTSISIPQGYKIFVNVAWDANVPPPPDGNEDAIQRAMNGDELDKGNLDDWFVPVIVSEGRFDTDKGNKLELSVQRIEAQTQLVLSRQIGTPNIAAKGKLQPRTVSIPSLLARAEAKAAETRNLESKSRSMQKPLIQEIMTQDASDPISQAGLEVVKPKSILRTPSSNPAQTAAHRDFGAKIDVTWSWYRTDDDRLQIQIEVPPVYQEKTVISRSNLDIEPRRLIFSIPDYSVLDLNLSLSDAELVAYFRQSSTGITNSANSSESKEDSTINKLLSLKRQRPFNVEAATAEWFIADNRLLISV
ncbi:hypothetical protein HHX47_DHR8000178 [Lentinula edodes]|nr:hypothetical protein HHX47_DHR8000178 [Lentinula edodes]